MFPLKERLKEILIKDNIIRQQDLDRALEVQKKEGGELSKILVKMKLIDESQLTLILSQGLGMPPIDIARLKIDPNVVKIIPHEIAVNYQIIPISKIGNNLTLAMADPLNIFAIDNVKALTGLDITPIIGRAKDIAQAIETYATSDAHTKFEAIIKDMDTEHLELIKDAIGDMEQGGTENLTQEAPIIKLTDAIIKQGVLARASDIFVEPMEKTLRIRYRVDGVIREGDRMAKNLHFPIVSRMKVLFSLDISEHRLPQDGRFRILMDNNREVDFRVNVLPAAFGEKVVLRILDRNTTILDITKLGFNLSALESLKNVSLKPHGMILTCGPTGSGKTTTLYSILKFVDSPEKNIVTVEDPVEYQLEGINQVTVRTEIGLTFAGSLRSILRQDPNVIIVGEIRDYETVDIAIKSALTGHLALSTLHTTTSSGAIVRLINMGVEPYLINSSLICVLAQRLVRKICFYCKEKYALKKEVIDTLRLNRD